MSIYFSQLLYILILFCLIAISVICLLSVIECWFICSFESPASEVEKYLFSVVIYFRIQLVWSIAFIWIYSKNELTLFNINAVSSGIKTKKKITGKNCGFFFMKHVFDFVLQDNSLPTVLCQKYVNFFKSTLYIHIKNTFFEKYSEEFVSWPMNTILKTLKQNVLQFHPAIFYIILLLARFCIVDKLKLSSL